MCCIDLLETHAVIQVVNENRIILLIILYQYLHELMLYKVMKPVYHTYYINVYSIPHLDNLFLFQWDVTRSFNRYEHPEKTVY